MTFSVFYAVAFALLLGGVGLFLILSDLLRVPSAGASRAFETFRKRENRRGRENAVDTQLERLAVAISRILRLPAGQRADLQRDLTVADMKISPEMHVANCIVKALVCAVFAIPAFFLFPILGIVILVCSVGLFADSYAYPARRIVAMREEIEYELPMFVNRIESMLRHTRDVVAILNSYRKNAGPALAAELAVTVADMQSGNAQEALIRLETRIGLPSVSDITRGLSAVLDGNDPVGYWAALSARLTDNRRQILSRKAHAVPAKIARLSFYLLGCIVVIYMTVILVQLMSSLGVMLE